jgi:DNA modification methylase
MDKDKLYYKETCIEIYNADFLTTECINENAIDLIVASPPYNVDISYKSYDDKIPYTIYLDILNLLKNGLKKPINF